MKQALKVKLEMAKFLQQTLDNMSLKAKGHHSESAKEFVEFFEKVCKAPFNCMFVHKFFLGENLWRNCHFRRNHAIL